MAGDQPRHSHTGEAAPQPMGRLEIGGELAALISEADGDVGDLAGSQRHHIANQRGPDTRDHAVETRSGSEETVEDFSGESYGNATLRPLFHDGGPEVSRPLSAPPIQPDVRTWSSEQQEVNNDDIRLDRNYYDYYHSFKPLDPRLPKPLDVSYYQNLKAHGTFESTLSERRRQNIHTEVEDSGHRPRNLVEKIQEDFPRTPSPVHRQNMKSNLKPEVPLVKELLSVPKHVARTSSSAHSPPPAVDPDMAAISDGMEALRVRTETTLDSLQDGRELHELHTEDVPTVPAAGLNQASFQPFTAGMNTKLPAAVMDDIALGHTGMTPHMQGGGYDQFFAPPPARPPPPPEQFVTVPNPKANNYVMDSMAPEMASRGGMGMAWASMSLGMGAGTRPAHVGVNGNAGPHMTLHHHGHAGGYQQVTQHHVMGMGGAPAMVQPPQHYAKQETSWSTDGGIVEPVVVDHHSPWGVPQQHPAPLRPHQGQPQTHSPGQTSMNGAGVHHHHHIYHHMHPAATGQRIAGMNGVGVGVANGIPAIPQRHQQLGYGAQAPGGGVSGKSGGGKSGKGRQMPGGFGGHAPRGASMDDPYGSENGTSTRSKLLDEFRSGRNRVVRLEQIKGSVVEFAADQYGSRFIQQKLEAATDGVKESVFEELAESALDLMKSVFGNYVIQKMFEYGLASHKAKLVTLMQGQVVDLSLHMYGCRVVQKAIEMVSGPVQREIVLQLQDHVIDCVKDQNGNHVIQKCIEHVPAGQIQFVLAAFRGQVYTVATHPYGCRVIQRILEHCSQIDMNAIVKELEHDISYLVYCQYGNYVVQHILERGGDEGRKIVIGSMLGHVLGMSQHKFASNVVEKCIIHASSPLRRTLIQEVLTGLNDDGAPSIVMMIKDQYANYVVQKMLDTCDTRQHTDMVEVITPHINLLKKFTYGKHILAKLAKESSDITAPTMN